MTVKLVIPAKAGIHVAFEKVKMDPRFRGNDDFLCADALPKLDPRLG